MSMGWQEAHGLGDRLRAGEAGQYVLEAVWDGQEAPSCLELKHVWAPVGHNGYPGQASSVPKWGPVGWAGQRHPRSGGLGVALESWSLGLWGQ